MINRKCAWVLIKCNDEALARTGFPKLYTVGVEVPEGHRRLILNMVTKIRTPKLKSGENRSFIPLNHIISEILGQRNAWFEVAAVFVYRKHTNKFENFQTLARKFGYQACHVCTQLEHVLLSRVHPDGENDGII